MEILTKHIRALFFIKLIKRKHVKYVKETQNKTMKMVFVEFQLERKENKRTRVYIYIYIYKMRN